MSLVKIIVSVVAMPPLWLVEYIMTNIRGERDKCKKAYMHFLQAKTKEDTCSFTLSISEMDFLSNVSF